jgi:hypothetical protein
VKKINIRHLFMTYWRPAIVIKLGVLAATGLMLYRLGSLTGGISAGEHAIGHTILGWHGLYLDPFYLPLKVARSIVFASVSHHGQTLIRLPDVIVGLISVGAFTGLIKKWHGGRVAVLAGIIFATTTWVLQVSRIASYDVIYLAALPLLLLSQALIYKSTKPGRYGYIAILVWGSLLYIPGMVWFVAGAVFWERRNIVAAWKTHRLWWHKTLLGLASIWWLPLLLIHLLRTSTNTKTWLGLPHSLAGLTATLHAIAAVPYQLLVQGPSDATLWLSRLPLLDIGSLALLIVGSYFYVRHIRSTRTQILASYAVLGAVMIGLGGAVKLSLVVPLLFIALSAGIAVLLHDWFKTFPANPLARKFGIILITVLVLSISYYNLDRYFVAWPNNTATQAAFRLKP